MVPPSFSVHRKKWKNVWEKSHVESFACFWPLLFSCGILLLCAVISGAVTGARSSKLHFHFNRWGKWPTATPAGECTGLQTHAHTLTLKLQPTEAEDVLTCSVGLNKTPKKSHFWSLTLQGQHLQWKTNDNVFYLQFFCPFLLAFYFCFSSPPPAFFQCVSKSFNCEQKFRLVFVNPLSINSLFTLFLCH